MTVDIEKKPKEFWKAVLGEIQLKVDSALEYNTKLVNTWVLDVTEDTLTIACSNILVKDVIEKKHKQLFAAVIDKISGKKRKIVYKVVDKPKEKKKDKGLQDLGPLFKQKNPQELLNEKRGKSNLSPKYRFDNYIKGSNNNLAYAIATAIADKPGELYNPFFLYSGVGMGKTHLIQAIGNEIIKKKPGMRVIYTTGEAFMNELIEAIKGGRGGKYTTNTFRNKYRKADVFLIDDVQSIIGKVSTQEEFFHTFNALYMAQKQIVITSDRPPRDFENIEERITSRFSSGIIADIQQPDFEMRTAILRTHRDKNNDPAPNEVLDYIAENIDSNVRELMGAYNQVLITAKASGKELTKEIAAVALGQSIKDKPQKSVNVNEILKAVCTYYSVKSTDIKGKRRTKEIVVPRQVAMYLMKEISEMPFMSIGDLLGGRDHTTIMHGVEKIQTAIKSPGKIRQDITNVRQILEQS